MSRFIPEKRLKELFTTLPNVTDLQSNAYAPRFDFGTEEDCVRYLNSKRKEGTNKYPIIWLQTPFSSTGKMPRLNIKLKLILAARTTAEMANEKRIQVSFEPILIPLLENIEKALQRSGFTKMVNRDKDVVTNHFNYGFTEHVSTDIWDAIKFECEIEMDDCPQRTIFY